MGSCRVDQEKNHPICGRGARLRQSGAAGARLFLPRPAQPFCGRRRAGRVPAGQLGVPGAQRRMPVRRDDGVLPPERSVRSQRGGAQDRRHPAARVFGVFCAVRCLRRSGAAVRRRDRRYAAGRRTLRQGVPVRPAVPCADRRGEYLQIAVHRSGADAVYRHLRGRGTAHPDFFRRDTAVPLSR